MTVITAVQSIFSASSTLAVGAEVLARWVRPSGQVITPAAAQPQDWSAVDLEIISQAAVRYAHVSQPGLVFLNTSPDLLTNQTALDKWLRKISDMQSTDGTRCVIEITETIPDELLQSAWPALTAACPRVALDDFGTQFSTLSRLHQYDWNFCKIDARQIHQPNTIEAIRYCQHRGITVIAECVENDHLRQQAIDVGVDWHQGFFWGHPLVANNQQQGVLAC